MNAKRSSLFHAIVVVGASLAAGSACSGDDERLPAADSPPADTVVADARVIDAPSADGAAVDAPTDAAPVDGDAMVIIL